MRKGLGMADWVVVRLKDHDQKVEINSEDYPQIGEVVIRNGEEYKVLARYFEDGRIHYEADGPASRKYASDNPISFKTF